MTTVDAQPLSSSTCFKTFKAFLSGVDTTDPFFHTTILICLCGTTRVLNGVVSSITATSEVNRSHPGPNPMLESWY